MERKPLVDDIMADLVATLQKLTFMDEESFVELCRGIRAYYDCGGRITGHNGDIPASHLQRIFMSYPTLTKGAFLALARNAYRILAAGPKNGLGSETIVEIAGCLSRDVDRMEEEVSRFAKTMHEVQSSRARWRV
ncbi:hypothetical protein [Geobacter anodireducens]